MLFTIDDKLIAKLPHDEEWKRLVAELGKANLDAILDFLNQKIDSFPRDKNTGQRTINSSHWGSGLSPWPEPLVEVYEAAKNLMGSSATEEEVQDYSGQLFGLIVWKIMMDRTETWCFYSEKADPLDPSSTRLGKIYFERK